MISYLMKNKAGIAALFTVIVIGSAGLLMAYGAVMLGIGELELGYTASRGAEAFALADGCVDEALERLRVNESYSGGILTLPNGWCDIQVQVIPSPTQRTITVTGTINTMYYKKLQTVVTVGSAVTIDSWLELST